MLRLLTEGGEDTSAVENWKAKDLAAFIVGIWERRAAHATQEKSQSTALDVLGDQINGVVGAPKEVKKKNQARKI
jgi:hypothetical protein